MNIWLHSEQRRLIKEDTIPAIPPRLDLADETNGQIVHDEVFVHHPQVAALIMETRLAALADWLAGQGSQTVNEPQKQNLIADAKELLTHHIGLTVQALAGSLPIVDLVVNWDENQAAFVVDQNRTDVTTQS